MNLNVKQLKEILNNLDESHDNDIVIFPVVNEDNCENIFGYRMVRTVGILKCDGEDDALCLAGLVESSIGNKNIETLVSKSDIICSEVLF